jgi:6-pyruvoyltetrahydropterin/6-carboxytetrahydropterin synthase
MKVTVLKEFKFDAAHWLPGYNGKCQNVHGHTYKLQVGFTGEVQDDNGMVVDFSRIKEVIKNSIIDHLDHKCLNDVKYMKFPYHMPTAENMVLWFVSVLDVLFVFVNEVELTFVRLYETETSYAEWRK